MWITKATDEDRKRLDRAIDQIVYIMKVQGYRPETTAMVEVHHPQRYIPEENSVQFRRQDYPDIAVILDAVDSFGNRGPGEVVFVPEVKGWLDKNCRGWSVDWGDRGWDGDWSSATLKLGSRQQVQEFIKRWGIIGDKAEPRSE
jgi:hypothetical protein